MSRVGLRMLLELLDDEVWFSNAEDNEDVLEQELKLEDEVELISTPGTISTNPLCNKPQKEPVKHVSDCLIFEELFCIILPCYQFPVTVGAGATPPTTIYVLSISGVVEL